MSAPALAGVGTPTLRIRGRSYPVLLPSIRDPRLHLASVIVSLQVLGQVALDFHLSIAQILVSLAVCAVLEVAIAFRRQRALLWPASALLTGNGVAFVLRVPGTEHGDWWSMNGWWIFAGTAAVALLSKYLIRFRGRHVFNPSNFGLVLCFLLLGSDRADPLALWWGPMSPALALALVLIVVGGVVILRRLRLLAIAVAFWLAFAAGIGVLAASGHEMTAPWHLGPISGLSFWWVLVSSPEILVFLFFMITDPKTIPDSAGGRRAYAVAVALLATVLIAPQTSEFATKVAVLSALALACAARPVAILLASHARTTRIATSLRGSSRPPGARRARVGVAVGVGAVAFAGVVVLAGIPARPTEAAAAADVGGVTTLPTVTIAAASGLAPIDAATGRRIARDVVVDLRAEEDALRRASVDRAKDGASGDWLARLWRRIGSGPADPPVYDVDRMRLTLRRGDGQSPPVVVATLVGTWRTSASTAAAGERPSFRRTVELVLERGRYLITRSLGGVATGGGPPPAPAQRLDSLGGVRLQDVAAAVGLRFRQAAFRFGVSNEPAAMMGGGLCWLDFDSDGWLDLYAVNAYADVDYARWDARGGLPRGALFRNVGGRFENVSRGSGTNLPLRGNGCVAADFDLDGNTDLFVTTAGYNVATDGYDALLWGHGDGTFTEGARLAGINTPGWHAGAAVGDVDGNGWPDLFVAGYTDVNAETPGSISGFPGNRLGVQDRLYLNQGPAGSGRPTFREVGAQAGIERGRLEHGLGAVLTDVDGDGRLDLYVANDTDPNRLYLNRPAEGPLGFHFEERGAQQGVADPNAGMGIAAQDFSRDGRVDLLVTNSRGQLHAAYRSRAGAPFADARPGMTAAFGTRFTGWGVSWPDLDLDGDLDLVVANGAIPMMSVERDAERIGVLGNVAKTGGAVEFADARGAVGLRPGPLVNGRGLAAADFDNDGDVDIAIGSISGPLVLLRSTGASGHWLEVRLKAFAPGARVTVELPGGRTLVREVQAGSSYLSSEDPRVHFGLGGASRVAALVVRYPGGRQVRLTNVAADRIVDVD